jgi:hypothetical protein
MYDDAMSVPHRMCQVGKVQVLPGSNPGMHLLWSPAQGMHAVRQCGDDVLDNMLLAATQHRELHPHSRHHNNNRSWS